MAKGRGLGGGVGGWSSTEKPWSHTEEVTSRWTTHKTKPGTMCWPVIQEKPLHNVSGTSPQPPLVIYLFIQESRVTNFASSDVASVELYAEDRCPDSQKRRHSPLRGFMHRLKEVSENRKWHQQESHCPQVCPLIVIWKKCSYTRLCHLNKQGEWLTSDLITILAPKTSYTCSLPPTVCWC